MELKSDWNESSYEPDTQQLYTTNSEGHPTTTISQSYILGSWHNTARDRRTYPSCSSLSIEEEQFHNLALHPNPTRDKIYLNTEQESHFTLTNTNGQVLNKGLLVKGNNNIDLSQLNNGLYFLSIKTAKGTTTKKIIKN